MDGKWNSPIVLSFQGRVLGVGDIKSETKAGFHEQRKWGKQNLKLHLQGTFNQLFKHSWNKAFIYLFVLYIQFLWKMYTCVEALLRPRHYPRHQEKKKTYEIQLCAHHCSEMHIPVNVGFKLILNFEKAGPLLTLRQHNVCLFLICWTMFKITKLFS